MSTHRGISRYRFASTGIITIAEALALVALVCAFLPYAILAKHFEWSWGMSFTSRIRAFTYRRMCRIEARVRVLGLHLHHHKIHIA
ncbi:hypothetical protein [Paeniglutamicibacter sp. NPDC091659]|uniref:hypothetical protein n=1 Tax=Paeniglutamicibacter sp. NPDC091659 TaxID=3364389 RepID=UPI00381A65D9